MSVFWNQICSAQLTLRESAIARTALVVRWRCGGCCLSCVCLLHKSHYCRCNRLVRDVCDPFDTLPMFGRLARLCSTTQGSRLHFSKPINKRTEDRTQDAAENSTKKNFEAETSRVMLIGCITQLTFFDIPSYFPAWLSFSE